MSDNDVCPDCDSPYHYRCVSAAIQCEDLKRLDKEYGTYSHSPLHHNQRCMLCRVGDVRG